MREYDEGYYDLHGSEQAFSERPVVLLSTERSGSNLLRSILNTHSSIAAPHPLETGYPWRNLASPGALSSSTRRSLLRDVLLNKHFSHHPILEPLDVSTLYHRLERVDDMSFLTVQELLYSEYARTVGASTWVSKDPSFWGYFEELREYYDDPLVVYLVRDPRDVVLSFKRSNVGRSHPYFSAERWREEQTMGRELLESSFAESIHLIRYRDLLREPERVVATLCKFLDVDYEPEMLYFFESEKAREAAESAQAFENLSVPIKSDNYAKYEDGLEQEELALVERVVGETMLWFGFDRETSVADRSAVEINPDRFRREDARGSRRTALRYWRHNPREQLRRFSMASFKRYMVLRYGLLA